MNRNDDLWNTLAERGTPRGADAVINAAMVAAGAATNERAASAHDGKIEPIELAWQQSQRRSKARRGFGAFGLAALLGVGGLATYAASQDHGGANSPEGAVTKLADAINSEDLLAAVDVLAPNEVRSLHDTVSAMGQRAADEDLVRNASAPLAGLDLEVHDLNTSVEQLADGYAKVSVKGTIAASTNRNDFGELLQRAVDAERSDGKVDLAELDVDGVTPFVITVRDGGQWYVSPAYTALEYIRLANELPVAEFGSSANANLGADSAEAAAIEMMRAIDNQDWVKVASLVPPGEFPLYDYRAAFAKLLNDTIDGDIAIDTINAKATVEGTEATITLDVSGTTDSGDEWKIIDSCLHFAEPEPGIEYRRPCATAVDVVPLIGRLWYGETGSDTERGTLHATQRDGRWFIAPVGTIIDGLDEYVRTVTRDDLAALLGVPEMISSSGVLQLNAAQQLPETGFMHRYELRVDRVERVVVREGSGYARIIDDRGNDLEAQYDNTSFEGTYELHPNVTYSVVVESFGSSGTFIVWRSADAPPLETPDYETPDEECITTGSVTECSSTSSTAVTKTTMATVVAP